MKIKILLFAFLFSLNCFSQFSKTHYIPPVSNAVNIAPQEQFMYISCPSITPVNYKVIQLGGTILTGTVSRDNPAVLSFGAGENTQFLVRSSLVNNVLSNKGFIVEAEDLVYVAMRFTATPQNYHAGSIVSKGLAALGTRFRVGGFFNLGTPDYTENHYTFASILATENNTTVSFSDIDAGATLINNLGAGSTPAPVMLNSGQSYVIAVQGPNDLNRDALIGMLITSDKPIAVNCGSIAGSNSNTTNLDLGQNRF